MTAVAHTASPCLFMLRRFAPSLRTPGALRSPIGWQRGTSFADTRTKNATPCRGRVRSCLVYRAPPPPPKPPPLLKLPLAPESAACAVDTVFATDVCIRSDTEGMTPPDAP